MITATEEAPAAVNSAPNKRTEKSPVEVEYNSNVPTDLINPDPNNRDKIDPERVQVLASNIKEVGLLQPVVLRMMPDGKYRLIAGEHRWRAYRLLKLPTIAARIYRDQSELEAAKKKTAENAIRVDLTPIEKAKRYKELQDLGASQKEIGMVCGGLSQPVIANALRMLTLPEEVQKLISEGELTEAHGVTLARFSRWKRLCIFIAKRVVSRDEDDYSTKDLNRTKLPFSWQAVRAGVVVEIKTRTESWSNEVAYKIPETLPQDDFIQDGSTTYYVVPENAKDNVWLPEKARQDATREEADKEKAKKNAESLKKGKPTASQLERKKKLDENKRARTTITVTLTGAVSQLAEAKKAPSSAVHIMFEKSAKSGFLEDAARMLGIKLPATDEALDRGYDYGGERRLYYKPLYGLDDDKLIRLAACTVVLSEASDAQRFASDVPGSVEHIAAGKLLVPAPDSEELKNEKPEFIEDIERRLQQNYTPGELAKEYADRKGVLPVIKAQAVIDAAAKPKGKKKGSK